MTEVAKIEETVMIEVVFTRSLFEKLMEIWPNPENGKRGLNQSVLARATGISQGAISNYLKPEDAGFRYPLSPELRKLGKFFGIITFVEDWSGLVDNDKALKVIEAFLDTHVYRKAS